LQAHRIVLKDSKGLGNPSIPSSSGRTQETSGLYNHRPIPEDLKNGIRNIKVIRDCGGMQRFSGDKPYEDYNRCQWENIPYERYECQCGPNPKDQVP
jgi:hypothetical protein